VALSAEQLNTIQSQPSTESPTSPRLQQLIDNGTVYVARNLTSTQFATLQAIAPHLRRPGAKNLAARLDTALVNTARTAVSIAPPPPLAFDYQLGLDELDILVRTRTGYPFADLHPELQEAILGLIASRDLTSRKLDLALWLQDLRRTASADPIATQQR
jgi:hypothetical protein